MKNAGIPKWIEETLFQCDITKESYNYKELNVVWYDKIDRENPIRIKLYDFLFLLRKEKDSNELKTPLMDGL